MEDNVFCLTGSQYFAAPCCWWVHYVLAAETHKWSHNDCFVFQWAHWEKAM